LRGSLQMAKYECTVRHLGKSLGSARHWQPVRSRYSTAQNTSYRSTLRGAVFLRALSSSGLMASNCSRVMSLGYPSLMPQGSHGSETLNTLSVGGTRQKLSMISTVNNRGKAHWMIIDGAFNHERLIEFLQALAQQGRQDGKKVFLILMLHPM